MWECYDIVLLLKSDTESLSYNYGKVLLMLWEKKNSFFTCVFCLKSHMFISNSFIEIDILRPGVIYWFLSAARMFSKFQPMFNYRSILTNLKGTKHFRRSYYKFKWMPRLLLIGMISLGVRIFRILSL